MVGYALLWMYGFPAVLLAFAAWPGGSAAAQYGRFTYDWVSSDHHDVPVGRVFNVYS